MGTSLRGYAYDVLLARALLILALLGIWIYCVFDVIRAEAEAVRYLHKLVWLAFVVLVPSIGALAWLFAGRPVPLGSRLFEVPKPQVKPPDDSPEFLASLSDEIRRRRARPPKKIDSSAIDEEIRRLEEEFRRGAQDQGDQPEAPA